MKSLILITFAISLFAFISCSKTRTCICTEKVSSSGNTPTETVKTIKYEKITKKKIKDVCSGGITTQKQVSGNSTYETITETTCTIK